MKQLDTARALTLALIPFLPTVALAQSEEVQAIEEQLRQYEARFNESDAAAVSELFSEDVVYYDALGQVHEGRAAVRRLYEQNFAAGFSNMNIETIEVEVHDSMAYDIARYTISDPAGELLEGYHLAILAQEDGEWIVQRTLVNVVMPEPQAN